MGKGDSSAKPRNATCPLRKSKYNGVTSVVGRKTIEQQSSIPLLESSLNCGSSVPIKKLLFGQADSLVVLKKVEQIMLT